MGAEGRWVAGVMCGVLALLSVGWSTNGYFFDPETLRVGRGETFEWHLMMVNEVELCGYGFAVDAPVSGATLFAPETLLFDWTGSAADIGGLGVQIGPEYSPEQDWFGGAAAGTVCPPGVEPGTYVAVRIYGTISETAGYGTYQFWGPHGENPCDFTDGPGNTFDVPVDTGWIEIAKLFVRGDADASTDVLMADAVFTLKHLYVPGSPDPSCMDAADTNDDGQVLMNDVIYTLEYLYVPGAPTPPPPGPSVCGADPTMDGLDCADHPCMEIGLDEEESRPKK